MIKLTNLLIEKHLTSAEKKKKEEIVKALKKSNPKMPKPKMYAIATKKAEKLVECDECGDGQKTNSSMLKGQLRDLIMNTSLLYKIIEPGRELPGWIVSYISLADDYIHSVKDHVMEWKSEHGELDEISASPYHFNEVEVTGYVYDEQADVEVEPMFKAKFEFKKGSDDADLVSDIEWNKEDFDDNENNAIEKWLKVFKNHNEIENQLKDEFFETYEDSEDDNYEPDLDEDKEKYSPSGIDLSYTHFALGKDDNKIVDGWDYTDVDKPSIKYYTDMDLKDNDYNPKDFKILSAGFLKKNGLDPFDAKNWRKNK